MILDKCVREESWIILEWDLLATSSLHCFVDKIKIGLEEVLLHQGLVLCSLEQRPGELADRALG